MKMKVKLNLFINNTCIYKNDNQLMLLKLYLICIDNFKKLKAPEFIAKPHSTIVLEGSVITLDCAAVGNPRPLISWLKDGTLIDVA